MAFAPRARLTPRMPPPSTLPVSVVVPCHNHARFVGQCLRSIADGPAVQEVILVDNASTDGSAEVAEAVGLPNLRVIRNAENLGATRARDVGVQASASDLIAFVDSDDWLSPGALGAAYAALRRDELDYSVFELWRVEEDESAPRIETPAPNRVLTGMEAFASTIGGWRIFSMGLLEKRVYLEGLAAFRHHGYGDDELLIRHTFLAARRVGGNAGVYYYRSVPKPYDFNRVLGQVRANLGALEMAAERRTALADPEPLRRMRNQVARNMLGLAARARREPGGSEAVRPLAERFARLPIGWTIRDARPYAMRLAWPLLLRGG